MKKKRFTTIFKNAIWSMKILMKNGRLKVKTWFKIKKVAKINNEFKNKITFKTLDFLKTRRSLDPCHPT